MSLFTLFIELYGYGARLVGVFRIFTGSLINHMNTSGQRNIQNSSSPNHQTYNKQQDNYV